MPVSRCRWARVLAVAFSAGVVATFLFAISTARPTHAQTSAAATQSPAPPPSVDVTGTVDTHRREQTLLGFGTALAYYANWAANNPYHGEIYDALFKGLNLHILRLRDCYADAGAEAQSEMSVDEKNVQGASAALGHPVQVMLCSWAPPAALKSNGETGHGGTLIKVGDQFAYGQFAQYWADSLAAYAKLGVVPTYVTIQNEPDWKADYQSCVFSPQEGQTRFDTVCAGYDKAVDAVYKKLQTLSDPPKLIGPETIGIGYGDPENYFPPDNSAMEHELWGLSHHLYHGGSEKDPDSFDPRFQALAKEYAGKPKLMTEFDRGTMFQTAWVINNCLTEENAAAYVYWSGVWPNSQALIYAENPDDHSQWTDPHGWHIGDHYWAIKHFSYFTGPGYVRVDTQTSDPSVKMSAFISPNRRKLCVVLLNTSPSETAVFRLHFNGYQAHGSQVYRTTQSEHWVNVGALPGDGRINLAPQSIVTVALQS